MKKFIGIILTFCFTFYLSNCLAETLVEQRPDVQQFIQYMAEHYHYNPEKLTAMFNTIPIAPPNSQNNPKYHPVLHQMKERHDFIPWFKYRAFFIKQIRIHLGAEYWNSNKKWLDKANQVYGVPQSIIVATIGVESKYGHEMGNFPVFQSLAVLAFDNHHRKEFFRKQLIAFLLYCKNNDISALSVHGSYAGAIGQPQFMPSNLSLYGVDFDHSGKVNIIHDPADAIGSVAKFFHVNHWQKGGPIATPAVIKGKQLYSLLKRDPEPKMTIKEFAKYGITPKYAAAPTETATLLKLTGEQGPAYWLVFHNFYVLKNYNDSTDYAMALYQLSLAIRDRYYENYVDHHKSVKKVKPAKPHTKAVTKSH